MNEIFRAMQAAATLSEANYLPEVFHVIKSFSLIEYAFANFFKWSSNGNSSTSWQKEVKYRKELLLNHDKNPSKVLRGCRTCVELKSRTSYVRCFDVVYTRQQKTQLQSV